MCDNLYEMLVQIFYHETSAIGRDASRAAFRAAWRISALCRFVYWRLPLFAVFSRLCCQPGREFWDVMCPVTWCQGFFCATRTRTEHAIDASSSRAESFA